MTETRVVRIARRKGVVVQDCDVYIGRACFRGGWELRQSRWHNPFSVKAHGREEALRRYEEYIRASPLMAELPELRGKVLGCWCRGEGTPEGEEVCHGDVLVRLLREREVGHEVAPRDHLTAPRLREQGEEGART